MAVVRPAEPTQELGQSRSLPGRKAADVPLEKEGANDVRLNRRADFTSRYRRSDFASRFTAPAASTTASRDK